jgi:hypothetical protein
VFTFVSQQKLNFLWEEMLTGNQVHSCALVADTSYGNEACLQDHATAVRLKLFIYKSIISATL